MNAPLEDRKDPEFRGRKGGRVKESLNEHSWIIFPVFIFWLIGVVLGIYGSKLYFSTKLHNAVEMNRIMIETKVYDLMPYDKTVK